MPKMDDAALRALVLSRRDASSNRHDTEYSRNRREALAFYRGDPHSAYGTEEPGMSQVISRDTMEAVESMLPGLLKPFVSGDEVVRFEPTGPEDEDGAKQAGEYINYLFTRRNDGYGTISTSMKDGLLFRLGVAKVVREEVESYASENYAGLSDLELEALDQDKAVEIVAVEQDEMGLFSVQVQRKKSKGQIVVYCVAPDEFLFERHLASLMDSSFVGQQARRSVADLIAMGLPRKKCEALTTDSDDAYSAERAQRFDGEDSAGIETDTDASRMVRVTECYIRCDYEGNGKLVWRKLFLGGDSDDVLSNDPVDCHPYVAWTPIPIPHKLVGLSIHDLTRDIQLIKTALAREVQNNLYLSNRPMREVVDGQVNIDDVLNPRVGGVVRVKSLGSMREVVTPFTAAASMGIVEYYDTVREQRTGSTRYNQGMDADSLNKTATGISSIMAAASQRLEMVSRQYAEQFLKPLFLKMLELVCKHPDQQEVIRLRNEWVEMDPRQWSTEYDMTVTVGLGTGSREKMVMEIQQLLQIDAQIFQLQGGANGPLLDYAKLYGKLKALVEAMGLKGIENFYNDPEAQQDQQQPERPAQPDPAAAENAAAMAQMGHDQAKAEHDGQIKLQIAQMDNETKLELARIQAEVDLATAHMATLARSGDGPGADNTQAHETAEAPQYEQQEPMMEGPEGGY